MTVSYLIILGAIAIFSIGVVDAETAKIEIEVNPTRFHETLPDIPPRPIPTLKGDISTISVGSHPIDIAVNPITNKIYVCNLRGDTVSVIDGSDNTIDATINVGVGPKGIAVNPITNTIYVTSQEDNTVSVIDGSDNTVIGIINVDNVPQDVTVNPTTNTIYVSHSAVGIVSVIDGSDNTVIDTINLGVNPNYHFDFPGIAVNPTTNTIYVVKTIGTPGQLVSIIDGSDNSYMFDRVLGYESWAVAVNPTTNTIYVSHDEGSVSIIDGSDNSVIDTINLWVDPNYYFFFPGIAVNPTTNTIYMTNIIENTALAIDGSNNRVVGTIDVGSVPMAIAVNPATNTIYVANSFGSSISVIVLDSKPPVKETPEESVIEETSEKEPLQGIEEFVEQIDDTLGDQVSLEVNEEPIQMVEESLQGIAEFILDIGTETSKEIIEIGQSANKTLAETKQIVDQKNLEAKEIVEQKGSEAIQEIGEIIPEDNQMMYVGIGVIILIIIIAVIAVTKRKKSEPEDL